MAVLNIRVDDGVRDVLKGMADDEGVSLSEYIRVLLMEAIVPVGEERESDHSGEAAPESMGLFERQVLSTLHRILGHVLPEDANDVDGDLGYQLMRARILEEGFTGEYWYETTGFRTELSKRDCRRVSDLLQMFRIITYSIDHLENDGTPVDQELARRLEFAGFDRNDSLESHMADYVEFLMHDDQKWTELRPHLERHDNGNSHTPALDTYTRMLAEYRRIMDGRERGHSRLGYLLSLDELNQVADAQTHPANRSQRPGGAAR